MASASLTIRVRPLRVAFLVDPSDRAGRGEWSDLFSIADATQQLYLGLPSWHEWSEVEWKKKHDRKTTA